MGQPGSASEAFACGWGRAATLTGWLPPLTPSKYRAPSSVRAYPKVTREIMMAYWQIGIRRLRLCGGASRLKIEARATAGSRKPARRGEARSIYGIFLKVPSVSRMKRENP